MKKILIGLTMSCLLFSVNSNAQLIQKKVSKMGISRVLIGGGFLYGMPQSTFKNGYKNSLGFEGTVGFKLKSVYLTSTLGMSFFTAQNTNAYGTITNIPIKVGAKYYVANNFFVQGDVGVGFLKDKIMTNFESRFMRDFGIGFRYKFNEFAVMYDGWKRKTDGKYSNVIAIKAGIYLK